MNKKKWGGLIGGSFIVIISFIGLSSSAFVSKDQKTNEFKNGQVDVEIHETGNGGESYNPPTKWNGETYIKNVGITNKSNVKTLIRVAIVPRWVDENNEPWAGDTSYISIEFLNLTTSNEKDKWVENTANQGMYYYYNAIVKDGNKTCDLIKSVKATIPDGLQERYKGKKLIIDVKAETIMATREAYKKAWSGIENYPVLTNMLDNLCV